MCCEFTSFLLFLRHISFFPLSQVEKGWKKYPEVIHYQHEKGGRAFSTFFLAEVTELAYLCSVKTKMA